MTLRHWLLVFAVVGVVATAAGGTGAFSSASLDRGISVTVAEPEDAYLGLGEPLVSTVPDGGVRADLLVVTNNLDRDLGLSVAATEATPNEGPNVTNVTGPSSLGPGETGPVSADLACDSSATESVTVTVNAVGDGVRVEGASRTFDLTCA